MYKVAILQSDREAIRAGYVEIAPTLAEQAELLDYAFRVFDTSNLPEGNYYYTVINGSHRLSGVMMKKI